MLGVAVDPRRADERDGRDKCRLTEARLEVIGSGTNAGLAQLEIRSVNEFH